MTANELKKISRKELLELLIAQRDELARLQAELDSAKAELRKRSIAVAKVGTMAEAALSLNGVFEAADNAAKQYLENIKRISDTQAERSAKIEAETQSRCERILEEAKSRAHAIMAQAETESRKTKKAADEYLRATARSARTLLENMQARKHLTEEIDI